MKALDQQQVLLQQAGCLVENFPVTSFWVGPAREMKKSGRLDGMLV
jgi:hypothetical protein